MLERNQKAVDKLEVLKYLMLAETAQSSRRNSVTPTETQSYG